MRPTSPATSTTSPPRTESVLRPANSTSKPQASRTEDGAGHRCACTRRRLRFVHNPFALHAEIQHAPAFDRRAPPAKRRLLAILELGPVHPLEAGDGVIQVGCCLNTVARLPRAMLGIDTIASRTRAVLTDLMRLSLTCGRPEHAGDNGRSKTADAYDVPVRVTPIDPSRVTSSPAATLTSTAEDPRIPDGIATAPRTGIPGQLLTSCDTDDRPACVFFAHLPHARVPISRPQCSCLDPISLGSLPMRGELPAHPRKRQLKGMRRRESENTHDRFDPDVKRALVEGTH